MSFLNIGLILQVGIALAGAFFFALWISMIVWTFRDVRSRSRDIFAQLLATLMVVIFNAAGLVLYFLLRPKETLAEAYERALEEEALLQDIEERYNCPGCKQKLRPDYQLCPSCHARLKRPCTACNRLLQLRWDVCPYCGTAQALTSDGLSKETARPSRRSVSKSATEPIPVPAPSTPVKEKAQVQPTERTEIPIPASYQTASQPAVNSGGADSEFLLSSADSPLADPPQQ